MVVALLFAAFVVAAAMKMLLDMDSRGMGYRLLSGAATRISGGPLRQALEAISRP